MHNSLSQETICDKDRILVNDKSRRRSAFLAHCVAARAAFCTKVLFTGVNLVVIVSKSNNVRNSIIFCHNFTRNQGRIQGGLYRAEAPTSPAGKCPFLRRCPFYSRDKVFISMIKFLKTALFQFRKDHFLPAQTFLRSLREENLRVG